jgi:hypothetical protein
MYSNLFFFSSREIQTLQQENLTLEKQIHSLNIGGPGVPPNQMGGAAGGPPNKLRSFDNPSASSTASSGVGTSISSLNATNSSLNSTANGAMGGPQQQQQQNNASQKPSVVKQYMETKMAMQQQNLQQQQQMNNMNQQPASSSPSTSLFNSFLGGSDKNPAKIGAGLLSQLTGAVNPNNNSNNPNNMDPNNPNPNPNPNDNPLSAGLSLFGSKFTSGFDSLKSQAAGGLAANSITSKFKNPFSSS